MLAWKVALRFIFNKKYIFNTPTLLSILGMAIGVSCLLVTMGVLSGYETTLRKTIVDVTGHVFVLRRGLSDAQTESEFIEKVKPHVPGLKKVLPFVYMEAILPQKGKVAGVFVEGVDEQKVFEVLNLQNRVIQGRVDLSETESGVPKALIGKSLAKKFGLKVGDEFRIVIPMSERLGATEIKPRVQKFYLTGVLNLGRFDYDNRYILTSLSAAQKFAGRGKRVTGLRILLEDYKKAPDIAFQLSQSLGDPFWAKSWYDINRNLFEAVRLERRVIFLVLLIIVLVACMSVASTLFVVVLRRYREVSILKTLGGRRFFILQMFSYQGLVVGILGVFFGYLLALLLGTVFGWAQETWNLIPAETYKLDRIIIEYRWSDGLLIFCSSLTLCFIATWLPSLFGARMHPTQGLKYE